MQARGGVVRVAVAPFALKARHAAEEKGNKARKALYRPDDRAYRQACERAYYLKVQAYRPRMQRWGYDKEQARVRPMFKYVARLGVAMKVCARTLSLTTTYYYYQYYQY